MAKFRRILVKLSGEALMAPDGYWLDPQTLSGLAEDLVQATRAGFEIALVIGGGNIIRGARMSAALPPDSVPRSSASCGRLSTTTRT